ncbi:hypothetical protein, partial [Jannaschia formosa]|uniref:hypothetical protein n=1 Tax=Jannaschia formosa TaxID=2259592 RepID=UPI000E1BD101
MTDLVNGLGGPVGFGEIRGNGSFDAVGPINLSRAPGGGIFFGGEYWQTLWVDPAGTVTFDGPLISDSEDVPEGLLGIYPFFAFSDVDQGSGTVSPGGTSRGTNAVWVDKDPRGVLTVTWDDILSDDDFADGAVNAFQLRLIDGSNDPGGSAGEARVELRYEEIGWYSDDDPMSFSAPPEIGFRTVSDPADTDAFYRFIPVAEDEETALALPNRGVLEFRLTSAGIEGIEEPEEPGEQPPDPPDFTDPRPALLDGPAAGASTRPTEGDDFILELDAAVPDEFGFLVFDALGGNDTVLGDDGVSVRGGDGNDILIGELGEGDPLAVSGLWGGFGNDTLYSGDVETAMLGGPGDDVYHLLPAPLALNGHFVSDNGRITPDAPLLPDGGFDTAFFYGPQKYVSIDGVERLIAVPGTGDVRLEASNNADEHLVGNEGRNILLGYGGNDVMTGGAGRDVFCIAAAFSVEILPFRVEITDFGKEDMLLFDDALVDAPGSGDGTIDIRRIPAATVEALLASGEAGYDRARGVISLDRDG